MVAGLPQAGDAVVVKAGHARAGATHSTRPTHRGATASSVIPRDLGMRPIHSRRPDRFNGSAFHGVPSINLDRRETMPKLVNIMAGKPQAVPIWGFHGPC